MVKSRFLCSISWESGGEDGGGVGIRAKGCGEGSRKVGMESG